jgi:2-hydroxychromene-2-carboxylate isomerase
MLLQFWFDFASTYSYPAAMRIEQLARERGVPVSWNAFLLSRMFRAQGWNDSPFNLYPVKGRYMWRDLERICEAQHLPFRRPSLFLKRNLDPGLCSRGVSRELCRRSKHCRSPRDR